MKSLELLAPARTADIGIAAVDCGADAVYIAGPEFGARHSAGNSVEDIARLCRYAHRFGVRIYVTVNTIVFEDEISRVESLVLDLEKAGVDALIVQDLALLEIVRRIGGHIPLHASTQCAIRTPEKAAMLSSMGFPRIVLERQLSIDDVRAIRVAIPSDCEIEFFVHGALCVCYSGQCYMSEYISQRSANRGECIQACRSLYDLVDESGKVLVKDRALLSLKDYMLRDRIGELAEAGVCSFKIEGRLKPESYVRNTVRSYSIAIDEFISTHPGWCRASVGHVHGGFVPSLDKTFNRGYTDLYIDSSRGQWSSMNAPKSMGELIGRVKYIRRAGGNMSVTVEGASRDEFPKLNNGDGFAFSGRNSAAVTGFRGNICENRGLQAEIRAKNVPDLYEGAMIFRNMDISFEKETVADAPLRLIDVAISINFVVSDEGSPAIECRAETEDGRSVVRAFPYDAALAENQERMLSLASTQLSKKTSIYSFTARNLPSSGYPHIPASFFNNIRRSMAEALDDCLPRCLIPAVVPDGSAGATDAFEHSYKDNIANSLAEEIYAKVHGEGACAKAYEITHEDGAELMRTRYCIRYELGLCPVHQGAKNGGKLFLRNQGRLFPLEFNCRTCEMVVLPPNLFS